MNALSHLISSVLFTQVAGKNKKKKIKKCVSYINY